MAKALTERNGLRRNVVGGGKGSEEEEKRKSVIKITKSIDKGRVALFNDMVQGELRGIILL